MGLVRSGWRRSEFSPSWLRPDLAGIVPYLRQPPDLEHGAEPFRRSPPESLPKLWAMTTHILAMGGGGFSMSRHGEPTAIDRHLLDLSGKSSPLVCFAPTASADDPVYVNRFLAAYSELGARTMVLTLWQGANESVERLAEADVVVVGAGSVANLVALWHTHGVDVALRHKIGKGEDLVLGGVSAGASCWFQGCVTDAFGSIRAWRGGLGLLDGSFCPHFDRKENRAEVYAQAVASGVLPAGYAVDDGAAVRFTDGEFAEVVAEREEATVGRIATTQEPASSGIYREELASRLL